MNRKVSRMKHGAAFGWGLQTCKILANLTNYFFGMVETMDDLAGNVFMDMPKMLKAICRKKDTDGPSQDPEEVLILNG